MRRWACVITLLAGFFGDGYAWTVRPRPPVPIERRIEPETAPGRLARTLDWWRA
jgi:hypothetical protein